MEEDYRHIVPGHIRLAEVKKKNCNKYKKKFKVFSGKMEKAMSDEHWD